LSTISLASREPKEAKSRGVSFILINFTLVTLCYKAEKFVTSPFRNIAIIDETDGMLISILLLT